MRIVFCGGGTAGHVSPAIAIAESLTKKLPSSEILFIGRLGGDENRAVVNHGFKIEHLKISGFERRLSLKNIKNLFTAARALSDAKKLLRSFAPDVVVGTGGYVTWPVLKAAQSLKLPTVIHESNASPGLVTKLLAPKCNAVLLNFEGSEKEFKRQDNIKIVGNPIREDFFTTNRESARQRLGLRGSDFLISSFGGSGGSKVLNDVIMKLMKNHSAKNKHIHHIHSCGKKYYDELKMRYPSFADEKRCCFKEYIDDVPTVITASDIVITRCGAMTLSEISAAGVAAIMIPSPNVTNDHQTKNALRVEKLGGGILIKESELNERRLYDAVATLESDLIKRRTMAKKIKLLCVADAKEIIANEIISLAR